ncbi:MAG TPA: hypothetical protein VER12_16335 [Polyangiaceae bacterium]|nr:hypothetical protein [Polyangiaceae bacterium]HYQ27530.1 hypothetical protein [Polyangiaceae bacterium]
MRFWPVLILLLMITGCPGGSREQRRSTLPACSKFGDTCEFSPGKLGSCVMRDGCTGTGSECFTCQSQH